MTTTDQVLDALRRAHDAPALVWGNRDAAVSEIRISWAATVDTIRAAEPGTLLLCRVHPFFAPPTGWDPAIVPDDTAWESAIAADPVVTAKRALLRSRNVVVAVVPWLWDGAGPRAAADALARAAGLQPEVSKVDPTAVTAAATGTVRQFAAATAARLGARRALVTGDGAASSTRVGVVAGIASPAAIARLLADEVDVVLTGETVEWEGTPYIEDANAAGRRCALIAVGNLVSERPLTARLANMVRTALPHLPVDADAIDDPTWTPKEAA